MLQPELTGRGWPPAPVELEADDGLTLRGIVEIGGAAWALVLHDQHGDLDDVRSLAPVLQRAGWSSLLLDQRGHGLSEGAWDPAWASRDIVAASCLARERGAHELSLVAFGRAVGPALAAARELDPRALVLVSPPSSAGDLSREELTSARPRLFVAGVHDPIMRRTAQTMLRRSIGPRTLVRLPTDVQSTALLRGSLGGQLRSQILTFLTRARTVC